MALKRTPFYECEAKMGGKFVDFGGWELPVKYTSDVEEHKIVRKGVGLFDVSHMGEIIIEGENALKQVNYLVTNDVSALIDGQILYTPMMNETGGVVDDLLVYRVNQTKFFLVVNASNTEKDYNWMVSHNKYNQKITNVSAEYAQLAVQGPKSEAVLAKIFKDVNLTEIKYYYFKTITFNNTEMIISRTGYTGEDGFEIYFKPELAEKVWDLIIENGKEFELQPIGLAARDTLRLEKKMALYGHELTDEISPLEAALSWTIKMNKEEFIGKTELLQQKDKLSKKLIGVELVDKGVPRAHYDVCLDDGTKIGYVTSGTMSPSLNKPIALAMVDKDYTKIGTELFLSIHNKLKKAVVVKTPFL